MEITKKQIMIGAGALVAIVIVVLVVMLTRMSNIEITSTEFILSSMTDTKHTSTYDIGETMHVYLETGQAKTKEVNGQYNTDITVSKKIIDSNKNVVSEVKDAVVVSGDTDTEPTAYNFNLYTETKDFNAGNYKMVLEVKNINAKQSSIVEKEFVLNDPGLIMTTPKLGLVEGEGFTQIPAIIKQGTEFGIYYELYDFGITEGEIDIETGIKLETLNDRSLIFDVPVYAVDKVQASEYSSIMPVDTSLLEKEVYIFSITAKDNINGNQNTKEVIFAVV